MAKQWDDERWVRRVAAWLPRLAEAGTADEAAGALFRVRMACALGVRGGREGTRD